MSTQSWVKPRQIKGTVDVDCKVWLLRWATRTISYTDKQIKKASSTSTDSQIIRESKTAQKVTEGDKCLFGEYMKVV